MPAGGRNEPAGVGRSSLRLRLSDRDCGAVPALSDVRSQGLETDSDRAPAEPAGCAGVTFRERLRLCITRMTQHRRWVAGAVFAVVTLLACLLLGRLLTGSSWPLAHASLLLVAAAGACYFISFLARARGWRRLFPRDECPGQARCLASVGAAAASGVVLPFRLDYLIKIGTLRRFSGIRLSLEAIALSIISLGIVDAVAMLPLSISATATSSADLRGPLFVIVAFGVGCCILLLTSARLVRLPLLRHSRRLSIVISHVAAHGTASGRRSASIAALYLLACWTARALGTVLLLSALGLRFSPTTALCVICLSAAAGVVPITAGGLVVSVGATATILLTLGVGKDIAINFSLASGLLITSSATLAALCGAALSITTVAHARRRALRVGAA
jgi:lysylphosphatidylglycerol synthase-like protein